MKLKKILAAVLAGAMAVTTMAVSAFTVSAAGLAGVPEGTETVLAQMEVVVNDNSASFPQTLGTWGSLWLECYADGMAEWNAADNTYVKVTLSEVGQYKNEDDSLTNIEDMLWAFDQNWFIFAKLADKSYAPVTGVTCAGGGVIYAPLSDFTVDEYNGIGFNIQAGHVGMTVSAAEIVEFASAASGGEEDKPTDEPTVATLWEGTQAVGNWENWVAVDASKFANLSTGKLVVTITDTADAAQWGIRDGEWNNLLDYSDGMAAGTTSFEYTVSAADLAALKNTGLVIAGHDFTVTKVEYVSDGTGSSDTPSDEPSDEPVVPSGPSVTARPTTSAPIAVVIPSNNFSKFEIVDSVTGDAVKTSMASLAKDIMALEEGGELNFSTNGNVIVLRKKVVQALIDNKIDLTVEIDGITFIIENENLAKAKTINFRSIRKTKAYKELIKETDTISVSINEKGKVEFSAAE